MVIISRASRATSVAAALATGLAAGLTSGLSGTNTAEQIVGLHRKVATVPDGGHCHDAFGLEVVVKD